MRLSRVRIGTAGWSMPRDVAESLPAATSALQRYAAAFNAVEINSSFYRPHREATYARWAASVPDRFRFAVKLPKAITHEAGLIGAEGLVDRFLAETARLGDKRGPILIQTPPKLAFDKEPVAAVADRLMKGGAGLLAWEPRHVSWFSLEADAWLEERRIARVAADPARHPGAGEPGGWRGFAYRRLHGSPRMYHSAYDDQALSALVERPPDSENAETWIMFDNTASGEASRNAMALTSLVSKAVSEP